MNWKETLQLAWKNKAQIADGFWNKYIESKPEIEAEAQRRKGICESNICGYYDKDGKPETSSIPGKPACSICHCNIELKVMCTFCWCALRDVQKPELWSEMMTEEMDKEVKQKEWEQQFKNKPNNNIQ